MLKKLKEEIKTISEEKFGKRKDASGPLNHLKEEIEELLDVLGKGGKEEEDEWADCLLLLLDAWRIRYGNWPSYNHYIKMCLNKLEVVKSRKYDNKPDKDGIFRRDKNIEYDANSEIIDINKLVEKYN